MILPHQEHHVGLRIAPSGEETALVDRQQELHRLLASIDPQLQPGVFVFCALAPGEIPAELDVQMSFRELEATTVVVARADAEVHDLPMMFPCQWIILGVGSDLAAVGFLAAVTTGLATAGISVNAVSAYHHDHLFVPAGEGERSVAVLQSLQEVHRDRQHHQD
jgi:hypothetical protein